ncbi:MAG TPA: disulfide bond formation protein B [Azoarcus taiwanensis]|nr:disulfide bond formation protein B [Azoarcus taiwanensis]
MNPFSLPPRLLFLALFAVCTGLLAFGLYLQHVVGVEPCPMCIMQRYAFVAVALVGLVAGLHGPARTGSAIYSALLLVLSIAGGTVAAQQSILQRQPPDLAMCGPGLAYMVETYGLADALPMMFRGTGDCGSLSWTFLGLSIANWSLVCFICVGIFAVGMIWRGWKHG